MTPQRGVLDVVLQIAIHRARRIAQPRRHKDADRRQPLRMHVEKSEDLRLGIAERMPDGAGFECRRLPATRSRTSCPAPTRACRVPRACPNRLSIARPTCPNGPSPTTVSCARTSMPATNPARAHRACPRPDRSAARRQPARRCAPHSPETAVRSPALPARSAPAPTP